MILCLWAHCTWNESVKQGKVSSWLLSIVRFLEVSLWNLKIKEENFAVFFYFVFYRNALFKITMQKARKNLKEKHLNLKDWCPWQKLDLDRHFNLYRRRLSFQSKNYVIQLQLFTTSAISFISKILFNFQIYVRNLKADY